MRKQLVTALMAKRDKVDTGDTGKSSSPRQTRLPAPPSLQALSSIGSQIGGSTDAEEEVAPARGTSKGIQPYSAAAGKRGSGVSSPESAEEELLRAGVHTLSFDSPRPSSRGSEGHRAGFDLEALRANRPEVSPIGSPVISPLASPIGSPAVSRTNSSAASANGTWSQTGSSETGPWSKSKGPLSKLPLADHPAMDKYCVMHGWLARFCDEQPEELKPWVKGDSSQVLCLSPAPFVPVAACVMLALSQMHASCTRQ